MDDYESLLKRVEQMATEDCPYLVTVPDKEALRAVLERLSWLEDGESVLVDLRKDLLPIFSTVIPTPEKGYAYEPDLLIPDARKVCEKALNAERHLKECERTCRKLRIALGESLEREVVILDKLAQGLKRARVLDEE